MTRPSRARTLVPLDPEEAQCRRCRRQRDAGRRLRARPRPGRRARRLHGRTSRRSGRTSTRRPLLKGLPDDRCQCPHWGYVVEGQVTFRFADREEVYEAGDAFYAPPGHVPVKHEPGTEIVHVQPDARSCSATERGRCMQQHAGDAGRLRQAQPRRARRSSSSGRRPCCIANRPRRRAARRVDLRVDVLDVVADRLRRDRQPLGDLLVRQPAREQPQHLDLARRQPGRALAAAAATRWPAAPSTASTASPS